MQNENFYQAEEFLKLGLYPQAFEAFMSLEVGALDPTFLKPCMMALANQLNQGQLATPVSYTHLTLPTILLV